MEELDVQYTKIDLVTFVIGKNRPVFGGPNLIENFVRHALTNTDYCNIRIYICCRQLLLCRVALGKSFLQFNAIKMAHAPPGHHSVVGRPSVGGLSFPEYVVYRGEQVRI